MRVYILTASDKGAVGAREDASGAAIAERMTTAGYEISGQRILPDDRAALAEEMRRVCDDDLADLILTTGGTGFSPRDVTPEATTDVCERMAPGIAEALRAASLKITGRAMLSRAVSGIRRQTLIVNLPGSPKAVHEHLDVLMPQLPHGLEILRGVSGECAAPVGEHSHGA